MPQSPFTKINKIGNVSPYDKGWRHGIWRDTFEPEQENSSKYLKKEDIIDLIQYRMESKGINKHINNIITNRFEDINYQSLMESYITNIFDDRIEDRLQGIQNISESDVVNLINYRLQQQGIDDHMNDIFANKLSDYEYQKFLFDFTEGIFEYKMNDIDFYSMSKKEVQDLINYNLINKGIDKNIINIINSTLEKEGTQDIVIDFMDNIINSKIMKEIDKLNDLSEQDIRHLIRYKMEKQGIDKHIQTIMEEFFGDGSDLISKEFIESIVEAYLETSYDGSIDNQSIINIVLQQLEQRGINKHISNIFKDKLSNIEYQDVMEDYINELIKLKSTGDGTGRTDEEIEDIVEYKLETKGIDRHIINVVSDILDDKDFSKYIDEIADKIDAEKVIYGHYGYDNAKQIFDEMFYQAPRVSGISNNIGTVLRGSTITSVVVSWSISGQITSQTLTDLGEIDIDKRSYTFEDLNLTSNKSWSVNISDDKSNHSRSTSVIFRNPRMWGVSSSTDYNQSLLNSLNGYELVERNRKTFTINAGDGDYIYYAYPARLGGSTFFVGGFEGGFNLVDEITYTNNEGYEERYKIYRSANPSLGNTTVEVQ